MRPVWSPGSGTVRLTMRPLGSRPFQVGWAGERLLGPSMSTADSAPTWAARARVSCASSRVCNSASRAALTSRSSLGSMSLHARVVQGIGAGLRVDDAAAVQDVLGDVDHVDGGEAFVLHQGAGR